MLGFLYAFLLGGLALALGGGSSGASAGGGSSAAPAPSPVDDGNAGEDEGAPAAEDSGSGDGDEGGSMAPPVVNPPAPPSQPEAPDLPGSAYDIGWAGLSAEEQLIVELVNRARMDPVAEQSISGDVLARSSNAQPDQPLAVIESLSDAARSHSQDMDDRNFFDHVNPDGQGPGARASEEGYSGGVGENIAVRASSWTNFDQQQRAVDLHEGLWESDGHQNNLLGDNWNVMGAGYDYGDHWGYDGATFVTEKFGNDGETYLTGVVIDDEDGDDFYDIGEGQGDVRITAFDGETAYATATWAAGGYSLALPPGTYRVVFEGGELDQPYETEVTIGNENVKLDVIEDGGAVVASLNAGVPLPGVEVSEDMATFEVDEPDLELGLFEIV